MEVKRVRRAGHPRGLCLTRRYDDTSVISGGIAVNGNAIKRRRSGLSGNLLQQVLVDGGIGLGNFFCALLLL